MIDLSKDSQFIKKLSGVELRDNQGQTYVFSSLTKSQGAFAGYLGELDGKQAKVPTGQPEPRYVKITDQIVLVPVDLFNEFEANLAEERAARKASA